MPLDQASMHTSEAKRAGERAREERLRLALGAAQIGTFIWYPEEDRGDPDTHMLALFGLPAEGDLNLAVALAELIHPDDRTSYGNAVARATDPLGDGLLHVEFRIRRANDGAERWIEVTAQTEFDGDARRAVRMPGVAADISDRKKAEGMLRASEAGFRTLAELSPALLWQTDARGEELSFTPGWSEYTGQTASECRGGGWLRSIHPADRANTAQVFARAHATGQPLEVEHRIRRHDGVYCWFLVRQLPVLDDEGHVTRWLGAATDVHAQRMALEAAERLAASRTAERDELRQRLLESEEAERRRLACDLHDQVGQHLTALGLGLESLSNVARPGSEVYRRIGGLRDQVDLMACELHAVAVRLRPKALDDFGLEAALGAYAEEWSRNSGIGVDVHAPAATGGRLPVAIENALYRIAQEALSNVARHSLATRASLVVERRLGQVVAIVDDDGQGFDADAPEWSLGAFPADGRAGLGLRGIRERVALLGGAVQVESAPGRGTSLFVRIPVSVPAGTPVMVLTDDSSDGARSNARIA